MPNLGCSHYVVFEDEHGQDRCVNCNQIVTGLDGQPYDPYYEEQDYDE